MIQVQSQPLVHGPTKTSRLGSALTVDVTAPQSNLVVERGSHLARASLIVTTSARRIIELSKAGEKVESIAVVGSDGDPTSHPELREITENLRALRDKWFQRAKLCIFTNGFELGTYDLRQTLSMYDRPFIDFEWGTAKTFSSVTGAKGTVLAKLTKQLSSFDHVVIQARFFKGDADNSTDTEVNGWIKRLRELRPREVHILDGTRKTPGGKKLRAAAKSRQREIADVVVEKTGLAVTIHEDEPLLV